MEEFVTPRICPKCSGDNIRAEEHPARYAQRRDPHQTRVGLSESGMEA